MVNTVFKIALDGRPLSNFRSDCALQRLNLHPDFTAISADPTGGELQLTYEHESRDNATQLLSFLSDVIVGASGARFYVRGRRWLAPAGGVYIAAVSMYFVTTFLHREFAAHRRRRTGRSKHCMRRNIPNLHQGRTPRGPQPGGGPPHSAGPPGPNPAELRLLTYRAVDLGPQGRRQAADGVSRPLLASAHRSSAPTTRPAAAPRSLRHRACRTASAAERRGDSPRPVRRRRRGAPGCRWACGQRPGVATGCGRSRGGGRAPAGRIVALGATLSAQMLIRALF
eukprot:SAG22_NODE_23_length_31399_cov_35.631313_19_plen_283_part_00